MFVRVVCVPPKSGVCGGDKEENPNPRGGGSTLAARGLYSASEKAPREQTFPKPTPAHA